MKDYIKLFQIGDKVRLSAVGKVSNFSSISMPEWPIEVDWGCGWVNRYKPEDLELVLCP